MGNPTASMSGASNGGTLIMDVSYEDYPEYYAGKFSSNVKYANLILEKFKNRFISNFYKNTKKNRVPQEESKFTVVYKIISISEKGAISGNYYVVKENNKSITIPFAIKNGRWNDFETLLMENVEKLWSYDYLNGFNNVLTPYNQKLY